MKKLLLLMCAAIVAMTSCKNAQTKAVEGVNPNRPDETILLDSPHEAVQELGENVDINKYVKSANFGDILFVGDGTLGGGAYKGRIVCPVKYEYLSSVTDNRDFIFVSNAKKEVFGIYKIDKKNPENGKLIAPMIYHQVEHIAEGACFVCYRVENDKQVTMKIYSYNGDELSSIPKRVGEKEVLDMMGIYKDKNGMYHQKGN